MNQVCNAHQGPQSNCSRCLFAPFLIFHRGSRLRVPRLERLRDRSAGDERFEWLELCQAAGAAAVADEVGTGELAVQISTGYPHPPRPSASRGVRSRRLGRRRAGRRRRARGARRLTF